MFLWRRCNLFPALLVFGGLLLGSCSPEPAAKTSAKSKGPDRRPVPVLVATVASKVVPLEIVTFGTVEAAATVDIRAEVTGTLKTVHFVKGQAIKVGDLLFTLDARPFEVNLQQARANLARDLIKAKNSHTEAARTAELLKTGIATPSESDKIQADTAALDAVVQADEAAIGNAALQVEHCTLRSPVAGRTGNLLIDQGNLVKANDMILVTISQVHPIEVVFSIPQRDLPAVRGRMAQGKLELAVTLPGQETAVETGEVTFLDSAVAQDSGMIQLRGTFANEKERLWPGSYVNVRLVLERRETLIVPGRAVQTGRDNKYVYVVGPDNTVEVRSVVVQRTADDDMMVESGLNEGDRVVIDGQMRLTGGSSVEVKTSLVEPNGATAKGGAGTGGGNGERPRKGKEAGR